MTKKCSNCFQTKEVTHFYPKLSGFQSRCKQCNAEVVKAYSDRAKAKKIALGWSKLREKAAS